MEYDIVVLSDGETYDMIDGVKVLHLDDDQMVELEHGRSPGDFVGACESDSYNTVFVLSDLGTWYCDAYVVHLTESEMARVEGGEKVYNVVGWDRATKQPAEVFMAAMDGPVE